MGAVLTIQTAGMSDGRGPWEVFLNDVLLGQILDNGSRTSLISTFDVAASLLTGSDVLTLVYLTPDVGEGFSINFSELAIRTAAAVPEPGTLALLGLGFVGMMAARRRRSI